MSNLQPDLLDELLREHAAGNVWRHDDGDHALFKYAPQLVMSRGWNPTNRTARGIVFHMPTAAVVCRPMAKFFNLDEHEETRLENLPAVPAVVDEKIDGSCVSIHLRDGRLRCATPGSFVSEQARWAEEEIARRGLDTDAAMRELLAATTLVCEAVYPENVSVVDYGERRDLVLVAAVDLDGEEHGPAAVDEMARRFGLSRPRRFEVAVGRTMSIGPRDEGFVVSYWTSRRPLRVKVKGARYLDLHSVVTRLSDGLVVELLQEGSFARWVEAMPRAAREKADDISSTLTQRFRAIRERVDRVVDAARPLPTRKEQAFEIERLASVEDRKLVFLALDGKLSDESVWKAVRRSMAEERRADGE